MKAIKFKYKNQERIKLLFPYNSMFIQKIKEIKDCRWSQSNQCWHIPYSEDAFMQLKSLIPDVETRDVSFSMPSLTAINTFTNKTLTDVEIDITDCTIYVKMPKNEKDVLFIKHLKYSRWNAASFRWEITNYKENLDVIHHYFGERIKSEIIHSEVTTKKNGSIKQNELLIIQTLNRRLKLIFAFNHSLSSHITKIPYYRWDQTNKWWTVPFSEAILTQIKHEAENLGLHVLFEQEKPKEEGIRKLNRFDILNYRTLPEAYYQKMIEMRYSEHTIAIYKAMFEEFLNYHFKLDPLQITEPQIIEFLRYLVTERKVSTSYQNQAINAIKFYYEKVLKGQRKFYFVDRPRKEKTLPTVLSQEELVCLLGCVDNLKHKTILMLAYSAGLRLSEIINLQLTDLDKDRMQIKIRQAKGKKDRYSKLSEKFLQTFELYLSVYKPKLYVFEGQKGGSYSGRSVETMVKHAALKAGIQKKVTAHTLRHTFATHCLENGVDLRYIQSMLGHESSKTTEVYTHITTKGFDQIKSPLDNLNF